jgi:pimeloyl-ACP methyl ester carboxylesterase
VSGRRVGLVMAVVLGACSEPTAPPTMSAAAAVLPSSVDVTYCAVDGVALKMDVYQAGGTFPRPRPAVVGVHGGGWQGGDKKSDVLMYDVPRWQKRGLTVFSINYRTGQRIFPAYMVDTKCAVEHIKANAALYGIDSSKVVLWGHSAGGHIAAHTAYSNPGLVRAVVTYAAPFDPMYSDEFDAGVAEDIENVFGPVKFEASVSPLVAGSGLPMLMFHGTLDKSISLAQPQRLVGGNRTLTVIRNGGHYLTRPAAYSDSVAAPTRQQISNAGAAFIIDRVK